jgi:hypothetical protein
VPPVWLALLRASRLEPQASPGLPVPQVKVEPVSRQPLSGDWMSRKVEKACWEWS